jgi:hypothetical protein
MFLLGVAVVIGILYVVYPVLFRNEEAEPFKHPVPPRDADEPDKDGEYPKGYHYREEC